jgi:hypothetical protein
VPPERCPHCGRFLSRRFIATLEQGPTPCPRCDAALTLADVGAEALDGHAVGQEPAAAADAPTDRPATTEDGPTVGAPSVRPPDLEPDTVRDDVLAGWDVGVGAGDRGAWGVDRPPFPLDTVVVAGAAAAGLLVGAAVDQRRVRGAAIGAVAGAVAAAAARRLWRLQV